MSLIDEIINIQITQADFAVNTRSFDELLILGDSKKISRVASYGSLQEVVAVYTIQTPEYLAAKAAFSQDIKPNRLMIGQVMGDESFVDAYTAIKAVNNNFYGICITSRDIDEQLEIAAAVEADTKLFGCASEDENSLKTGNTTHLAYKLYNQKYARSFCMYSSAADTEYPEAALLGLMLSYDAGSANWAHRQLKGITGEKLNTTERSALDAVNANSVLEFYGRNINFWGKAAGGQYLDITHGTDWLRSSIQDRVANVLQASLKVEYTDTGIEQITTAIKATLLDAAAKKFLVKESIKVTAPLAKDVPAAKKAGRILPDVYFEAITSGAINKVQIQGVLSL